MTARHGIFPVILRLKPSLGFAKPLHQFFQPLRHAAAVPRRGAQDWDVAGAACILAEAGIAFEDVCIGALRFNRPEIRHGALAAVSEPSLKPALQAALVKVYGCPQPQEVDLERHKP